MTQQNSKAALVTGASSGIGSAIALRLAAMGYTVYGAARRLERLDELAAHDVRPLAMDVTDDDSLRTGVDRIVAEAGRLDVLVNNAGYGSYGALEDVPLEEARRQFDVNVFGAAELTRLVMPVMRQQRRGTIINISSAGGRVYGPLGGWYHSTKFALEALSDCLRLEAQPFGINVVVVEPGAITSEFLDIAVDRLRITSGGGAYADQASGMIEAFTDPTMVKRQSPPSVIADVVAKAVSAKRPRTRYVAGFGARPLILLRRVLPDRAFDSLIGRVAGTSG